MDEIFLDTGAWLRLNAPIFGARLLAALLVLLVGGIAAELSGRAVESSLMRTPMRSRALLVKFLGRATRTIVIVFAGVVALGQIGLDIGPLIAGIGIGGFIIGFAFKDSLSNLAAGLLLIFYQPFEIGEFVEVGGIAGTVRDMSVAATELQTPDGRLAIVPNSRIWNAPIINFNRLGKRRIEWKVGIGSSGNIEEALDAVRRTLSGDSRVLREPAPETLVGTLADARAELVVHAWVEPRNLAAVVSDLGQAMREALAARGIEVSFRG